MVVKHFEELGYSIVAEPCEYRVEYTIYQHDGYEENGTPLFHRKDADGYPNPVEDYQNAEPMFKGSVKWDGCSNWDFSFQEMNMFHGCSKTDLINLGLILGEAWSMTKILIPDTWSDDCAME
jgi:hypothetical protein